MYISLLTQLKNAQAVKKESIKFYYSKMDEVVLGILENKKYINSFEKKGRGTKKFFDIKLKYNEGEGAIKGVKLISKPSRKLYLGYSDIRPVKRGYGLLVISTPNGVITGQEAKKMKVGGELLFEIW